jgi:hypothetical protein
MAEKVKEVATTVKLPTDLHEKLSLIKVAVKRQTGRAITIAALTDQLLRGPVEAKYREMGLERGVPA